MAQHDYNIANQSGASFRQDLNNALSAVVTLNSGAASPSTTFAYQLWADTTAGVLKIRNAANNAWITLAELDGTLTMETGSAGSPGLYFRGDTNTGFFSAAADELAIATGGIQRLMIDSSGRVLLGLGAAGRAVGGAVVAQLGIETLGQAMSLVRNSADTSGAIIALGKSRATTAGGITAVQDLDILGELRFCGANGTDLTSIGAHIRAIVSGVVGSGGDTTDMPTALTFSTTPDGEATAAERLRISPAGAIFCGNGETAASPASCTIAGTGGSGTNITGATLTIQGGRGTGTGAGGPISFSTAAAGSTGSTLNAATERLRILSSGRTVSFLPGTVNEPNITLNVGGVGDPGNSAWITPRIDFIGSGLASDATTFIGATGAQGSRALVFCTGADGAGAEKMRISSSGTCFINTNVPVFASDEKLTVVGATAISHTNAVVQYINRSNDGTLVNFYVNGVVQGSISISGATTSYNGAHLSRWSQLPGGQEREEILRGTVLSNIDEICEWGEEDNEQLNRMKVSDVEGDKNVSGVFQAWDDDDDTYTNDFYCAMTGDFIIRIAEGVTIERGDLLMSAGDGTAKPQDDDIIRSKTIAKVTSTNVSCTYDDGSYCVPCVLMAC